VKSYTVILVFSTSHAIRVEKILGRAGMGSRLIPVPRHLGSNCGVCVRIERSGKDQARQMLAADQIEIEGFIDL
jgi:hypothetical protein